MFCRCVPSTTVMLLFAVAFVPAALAQQPTPSDAKATAWQSTRSEWQPLPDIFPAGASMKVMNGDPATGPADFYFKFPAKYGVPMHFHTPVERVFADRGTMEFQTRDGRTITLQEGGYVYFPARSPHAARCVSATDCTFYLSSSAAFDVHLIDDQGAVTRSWSAGGEQTRR